MVVVFLHPDPGRARWYFNGYVQQPEQAAGRHVAAAGYRYLYRGLGYHRAG